MHLAAINGHYKIVDELKHCTGFQLNATNEEGFTKMDHFLLERELRDRELACLFHPPQFCLSLLFFGGCRI